MTKPTTTANLAYVEDLAGAAIETRDSWRSFAMYLFRTCATPQLPEVLAEAYELLQVALNADEDFSDMCAHPAHHAEECSRTAASADACGCAA
ncbi:hypothetical protein ABE438_04990 [Bosea sp. TWI1241]|uniref:hypothetical protein n=1 Tax=Bosea sp. TWI1241 TaxID=3148904 RepID=UPI00320AA852